MNKKGESRLTLELTEPQLCTIADCVEDIHRFLAGETELSNTLSWLEGTHEVAKMKEHLRNLQKYVTPDIPGSASYSWSGGDCSNECQRKYIAMTYPIYREIRHQLALAHGKENVYTSPTLTCEDSLPLPIIKRIETKEWKRWSLEVIESQLRIISDCSEDLGRLLSGQLQLLHTTNILIANPGYDNLISGLESLKPLITPNLSSSNSSYGYTGGGCPFPGQAKAIAAMSEIYYSSKRFNFQS